MDYDKRFVIYLIILALIMLVVAMVIFAQKTPETGSYTARELFVGGAGATYYEVYQELVDCLIKYESSGNPNALGDNGRAHGLLQFHKPTFRRFCVEEYGYRDDIWDPEIQMECGAQMLFNNLIGHWSVRNQCI